MEEDWLNQVNEMKKEGGKDIWLVGGGKLITGFLNEDLIDEMIISLIPLILGDGIRLFPDNPRETSFEMVETNAFETGIVNVAYKRI